MFSVISANSAVATIITLNAATAIPDQIYLIGDPAIKIPCPLYGKFPSYVDVSYLYTILTPHPFISVVIDATLGPLVQLISTDPLDYGYYTIYLQATESFSGLTHITQFKV